MGFKKFSRIVSSGAIYCTSCMFFFSKAENIWLNTFLNLIHSRKSFLLLLIIVSVLFIYCFTAKRWRILSFATDFLDFWTEEDCSSWQNNFNQIQIFFFFKRVWFFLSKNDLSPIPYFFKKKRISRYLKPLQNPENPGREKAQKRRASLERYKSSQNEQNYKLSSLYTVLWQSLAAGICLRLSVAR